MSDWITSIQEEWHRRKQPSQPEAIFPLISQSFDEREIVAAVNSLLDGRITMANQVAGLEAKFAAYIGTEHAVMVNSGSSANLLAVAVLCNPARSKRIRPGDEVLIPAVAWSTSIWPWIQHGIRPVFVDVDPATLNVDPADFKRKITSRTKAFMAIHILGNAAPIAELKRLVEEHDLLWIEDTCESLGSRYEGRFLGGFGDFGCYSFYYSHHITTGEGGMVVCHSEEDLDLLKCLRSHGWSRSLSNGRAVEKEHADVDPRFLFVNTGFNLRPLELQAAIGDCQLRRLEEMNRIRNENRDKIIKALRAHPGWEGRFSFIEATPGVDPAWFGFVCFLVPDCADHRQAFLKYLSANGVENRPIVSGNFIRQPALKLFGMECRPEDFPGAEEVHRRGFFIGIHTRPLSDDVVARVAEIFMNYRFA